MVDMKATRTYETRFYIVRVGVPVTLFEMMKRSLFLCTMFGHVHIYTTGCVIVFEFRCFDAYIHTTTLQIHKEYQLISKLSELITTPTGPD